MEEKEIGKITHVFSKINVAVVKLSDRISKGDKIHVKGQKTDFEQTVESMQIEHNAVDSAEAGQEIGLKLKEEARENDSVLKVIE